MPNKSRKWWFLGVVALLAAFLLYRSRGALHLSQFSGAKLWEALRGANYGLLFLSVITIYLCYAIRAWRWQKFQAHVGQAKFWNIYSMNLAGFSALFLLGRAAEPVRPSLSRVKIKFLSRTLLGFMPRAHSRCRLYRGARLDRPAGL